MSFFVFFFLSWIFLECNDYYCGEGAICIVTRDGPTCKCPPGLLGNPFPGGTCVTDQCSAQLPCSEGQICINGRCKHRCETIVCGIGAVCDQATGKCVCEPKFIGNPDYLCMPRMYLPILLIFINKHHKNLFEKKKWIHLFLYF